MRAFAIRVSRIIVGIALFGCASDSPTVPKSAEGGGNSVTSPAKPSIQGADGSRTGADQISPAYDQAGLYSQLEADYYAAPNYHITLTGSGFGSTPGAITLSDPNFYIADPASTVWSPLGNSITFYPRSKLDAMPNGLTIGVTTGGSHPQTSDPYHILLVPTISTRAYGQCTWWVALEEIVQFGDDAEPQKTAYPELGEPGIVAIDDDYIPRQYDAWIDKANGHQAFVSSVSDPQITYEASKATITYSVTLTEYNVGDDERFLSYPTTVAFTQSYDPTSRKFTGPRALVGQLNFSDKYLTQPNTALHPDRAWRHGPADPVQTGAYITSPADQTIITTGDVLTLHGGGYRGISALSGNELTWTSNLDGAIGTGTSASSSGLSIGNHTITLTATASGAQAADVVHVTVVARPVLAAPSGLVATAVSSSEIDLQWKDNSSNESGFRIQRCIDKNCSNFIDGPLVGANTTSYQDKGLVSGTTYGYRVAAVNGNLPSAFSNTVFGTTSAPTAPPTGAPTASVSVSPTSVVAGQTANVVWSSTNANTCTKDWLPFDLSTSGTGTITPAATTTLNMNCLGPGGSKSASAPLTVVAAQSSCTPSMHVTSDGAADIVFVGKSGPTYRYQTSGSVQSKSSCSMSWSASSDQSWLSVSPSSGSLQANDSTGIVIQANFTGLQSGQNFSGTITFSSPGATGSPFKFVYALTVQP